MLNTNQLFAGAISVNNPCHTIEGWYPNHALGHTIEGWYPNHALLNLN